MKMGSSRSRSTGRSSPSAPASTSSSCRSSSSRCQRRQSDIIECSSALPRGTGGERELTRLGRWNLGYQTTFLVYMGGVRNSATLAAAPLQLLPSTTHPPPVPLSMAFLQSPFPSTTPPAPLQSAACVCLSPAHHFHVGVAVQPLHMPPPTPAPTSHSTPIRARSSMCAMRDGPHSTPWGIRIPPFPLPASDLHPLRTSPRDVSQHCITQVYHGSLLPQLYAQ